MPTKTSAAKNTRVGLFVTIALGLLMVFLFFIGSEQKIFARKNEYDVRLENVTGLAEGNPVKMSGVTIGVIREIKLPVDPKQKSVEIVVMIDRKFSERVRGAPFLKPAKGQHRPSPVSARGRRVTGCNPRHNAHAAPLG